MKKIAIVLTFVCFALNLFGCKREQLPEKKNSCSENPQAEGCPRSNGNIVTTPPKTWDMDQPIQNEKKAGKKSGNIISTQPKTWDMNEK